MGMPMWPMAVVQAVDFVVLVGRLLTLLYRPSSERRCDSRAVRTNAQNVNIAGSTRPAMLYAEGLYRRRVALAKTLPVQVIESPPPTDASMPLYVRALRSTGLAYPLAVPPRRMGEAGLSRRPLSIGAGASGCLRTVDSPPPTVGASGWQ